MPYTSFRDEQQYVQPREASMNENFKHIVVCADGTGNEGGVEGESNVFRFYRLLADDSKEQIAYYDQGLGTEKRPILGKAFGVGISRNIRDCYEFLVDTYEPGDRVFLLGFSRGAFTVRSLGGMIARCGLLKRKYKSHSVGNTSPARRASTVPDY